MSTVGDIINAAQARTNDAIYQANYFVDRLDNLAGREYTWDVGSVTYDPIVKNTVIESGARTNHSYTEFVNQLVALGMVSDLDASMPAAIEVDDIVLENIADFNFAPLDLVIPDRPEFVNPQAPTGEVNIDDVSVDLGERPEVFTHLIHDEPALPDPDSINIEQFLIPAPEVDYITPTNQFSFVEEDYSSEMMDSLTTVIKDDIENGGSGINPDDEQALFERARDRESATYIDTNQKIARQFAARGFKIPTGAMAGLMARARDGFNAAMSGVNRDIFLRRSELHVSARQFALQAGISLEGALLSYHGAVMERAMNAARLVAQFGIEYHNIEVRKFADRLEQWRTLSAVRTQWVDNAIKKTREYELKLQKMELVDKRNGRRTELMNAMNRAVQITEEIRRTELEIGKFQIENNKMRIEQSKLLTQNYAEIMRSNDAAARAYGEAIRAETLRNEPFRLRLEAHKEERDTALTKLRMQEVHKNTKVDAQRANLDRYRMQLQRYSKELDNSVNVADQHAKMMGFDLEGWKLNLLAQDKDSEMFYQTQKAHNELKFEQYRSQIAGLRTDADILRTTTDITRNASEAGIGLYENLIMGAQSALGTISTLSETVE